MLDHIALQASLVERYYKQEGLCQGGVMSDFEASSFFQRKLFFSGVESFWSL